MNASPCPVYTRTYGALTCHAHDVERVNGSLATFPHEWRRWIRGEYSWRYRRSGRYAANTFLRELQDSAQERRLANFALTAPDDALIESAQRMADRCHIRPLEQAAALAEQMGIEPPSLKEHTPDGAAARLACPLWWRRQLRREHGRTVEGIGRDAGITRLGRDLYATGAGVRRRSQQQARNRALLESLIAINEDTGECLNLQDVVDLTTASPRIRRNELMTRIAGFEAVAKASGHVGEFLTITCPSRFHASRVIRGQQRAQPNPKYDGSTPREAQQYLTRLWARARAALQRAGIQPYGFRVCEPQQDGTPHWHLLLFVPPEQADQLSAIIGDYACREDADEIKRNRSARYKRVKIDSSKGSAAGYIAKYIAKNIDGYGIEADLFGNDPQAAAARVDAWASTWGIRQFQQIGGPSVTVWRELRRLKGDVAGLSGELRAAALAADAGDWAAYVEAQGGATVARDERPIQPLTKYHEEPGRYGEPIGSRVVGVQAGTQAAITREHSWVIEWAKGARDDVFCGGNYSGLHSAAASRGVVHNSALIAGDSRPWTGVNNCTGGATGHEKETRNAERFSASSTQGGDIRACNAGNVGSGYGGRFISGDCERNRAAKGADSGYRGGYRS